MTIKAWITKYALTIGVFTVHAEFCGASKSMISYRREGRWEQFAHGEGRDWHRSEESALKRAEAMRIAKIQSHQRAIESLQRLSFTSGGSIAEVQK